MGRGAAVGGRGRCAVEYIDDVGEEGAVRRFVARERVEELGGLGQGEREDQPVGLGGGERVLGGRRGGVVVSEREVRDALAQVRLDDGERGAGRERGVRNVAQDVQRAGGVCL